MRAIGGKEHLRLRWSARSPFYWDAARPTLGERNFSAAVVRALLPHSHVVESSELQWIVELSPKLAPAVARAGLAAYVRPILGLFAEDSRFNPDATADATIEVVHYEHDVTASASLDGEGVGWGIHEPFGDVTEITRLWVDNAFRHRGIGTAIATTLTRDAFDRGTRIVFLESETTTVPLYQRIGFRVIGSMGRAEL